MALRVRLPNNWQPRSYQRPLWGYLEAGGRHAVAVWHRRAGKDDIALHWTAVASHQRVGNYWHMLPEYAQARKAIWDAINPHSGKRRIDEAFPLEVRKATNNHEMKIELKCGSIWQVVGSDNFNSLIGSPPIGVVFSEWSVADPMAYAYLSPILAENDGWVIFIYTARGYNHGHATYESAQTEPSAFAELLTVDDTGAVSDENLRKLRQTYRDIYGPDAGDAFFRQEMHNDWSAANIGSVIGSAIEAAERDGRICDFEVANWPVIWTSDIGFRDTTAWWGWQPKLGGFDVVDFAQGVGMDADDWCDELAKKPYPLGGIWLPHDARAKTFQSKHSAVERFLAKFGHDKVQIVPQSKIPDRINAARRVTQRVRFHKTNCKAGLNGLRSWSFDFDEEKRIYSREPRHDWASHHGDSYSYGCQVMETLAPPAPQPEAARGIVVGIPSITADEAWTLNQPRARERI